MTTACSSDGLPPELSGEATSVKTTGSVTKSTTSGKATLTASTGKYEFTESTSASAYIIAVPLFDVTTDTTKGGTWTFTETGKTTPKYKGTYKGDISKLGTSEVKLDLTVKAVADNSGKLVKVESEKNFDLEASTTTFEAQIPTVTASSEEYKDSSSSSGAGNDNDDPADDDNDDPSGDGDNPTDTEYTCTETDKEDSSKTYNFTVTLKTDGTCITTYDGDQTATGEYTLSTDGKYFATIYEFKGKNDMEVYEIKDGNTIEEVDIKADDGHSGDDQNDVYTGSDNKTYMVTYSSETEGTIVVLGTDTEQPTDPSTGD